MVNAMKEFMAVPAPVVLRRALTIGSVCLAAGPVGTAPRHKQRLRSTYPDGLADFVDSWSQSAQWLSRLDRVTFGAVISTASAP